MSDPVLEIDDALDALQLTVKALGGYKKVSQELRADMSVAASETWLRNCLNRERKERLDPDQVIALVLKGRKAGVHFYAQFLAQAVGYEPPVPLVNERAQAAAMQSVAQAALQLEKALSIAKTMGVDLEALAGGK